MQRCKDTTIDDNNNIFYIIENNYPLFRAISYSSTKPHMKDNHYYFFGIKNTESEYITSYENNYGITHEYETTTPLKLLAIDLLDKDSTFYKDAPKNIQNILNKNYGFDINKKRDSIKTADVALSDYICNNNFDGYASNTMNSDAKGNFHPELMICNANKKTKYIKQITTDDVKIQNILDKYKLKKMEEERIEKKQKAKEQHQSNSKKYRISPQTTETNPTSPLNSNIFNFSNSLGFNTPPTTPRKGGVKNKRTIHIKLYKTTFKNSKSRTNKKHTKTVKNE